MGKGGALGNRHMYPYRHFRHCVKQSEWGDFGCSVIVFEVGDHQSTHKPMVRKCRRQKPRVPNEAQKFVLFNAQDITGLGNRKDPKEI